ncbi:MAG TPA: hypothetical protein VJV96_14710 [Candidatus Angelobacter sp.]|nr:hypothetical protein [Candidatus Angelobacter sp.]
MNSRSILLALFPATVCVAAIACSAQTEPGDTWDVVGQYDCSRLNDDSPQEQKLFLLPDMSWERAAPFTPQAVRVQKDQLPDQKLSWAAHGVQTGHDIHFCGRHYASLPERSHRGF